MRKLLIHAAFWIVFSLMWDRIMYFYMNNEQNRLYFTVLDVSLVMAGFYGLYSYLVPEYFKHKSLGRLILFASILGLLLTGLYAWMMGSFLNYMLVPIHFVFNWTYKDLQYNRLFIALLGILAGCFVKLALDRFELRRSLAALEKEHTQAQLMYLKAQLNPHFLFNSLNSLYTQLELGIGDPKHTLSSLADMLRYQLYDCTANVITLDKEFAYLTNYVHLQKLRHDHCVVDFLITGPTEKLMIAPLLLIPFVENAFKHLSDAEDNRIKITINTTPQELSFMCSNTTGNHAFGNKRGIGLTNVRKRLELIYGHANGLRLKNESQYFEVNLNVNLSHA